MKGILIGAVLGFSLAVVLVLIWWWKKKKREQQPKSLVYVSIEDLRSVGELVVFKIVTKEIITTAQHWFGEWGKKYLTWLASAGKMAMIFEFEINFRYNLRSSDFAIQSEGDGNYRLKMPKCSYDIVIRDVSFYDEQNPKLLPWLLPDLLNRCFGVGFDESHKNHLKEEAKQQAYQMAKTFAQKMQSEIQNSASQTLKALAKGLGAEHVTVDFSESELIAIKVESALASKD